MSLEEKKDKLLEYVTLLDRLERKCEEVARWDSMAEAGELDGSNHVKVTALQIRSECETLAQQVQQLRARLIATLNQMPDGRQREVLELYYLNGSTTHDIHVGKGWSCRYVRRLRSEAIARLEVESNFFQV